MNKTVDMNGIEFTLLVKSLFLTTEDIRKIGGYKDSRQLRRFLAGDNPPHTQLVESILKIDAQINATVDEAVRLADMNDEKVEVRLVGYSKADYFEWQEDPFQFRELHLCQLYRTREALLARGHEVKIINFDPRDYFDFLDEHHLDESQESLLAWANHLDLGEKRI